MPCRVAHTGPISPGLPHEHVPASPQEQETRSFEESRFSFRFSRNLAWAPVGEIIPGHQEECYILAIAPQGSKLKNGYLYRQVKGT